MPAFKGLTSDIVATPVHCKAGRVEVRGMGGVLIRTTELHSTPDGPLRKMFHSVSEIWPACLMITERDISLFISTCTYVHSTFLPAFSPSLPPPRSLFLSLPPSLPPHLSLSLSLSLRSVLTQKIGTVTQSPTPQHHPPLPPRMMRHQQSHLRRQPLSLATGTNDSLNSKNWLWSGSSRKKK